MMYSFYMFNSFESDDCQMIYAITISAVSSLKNRLFVETTKVFISNSLRVYTDTFIDTLSQGWGF